MDRNTRVVSLPRVNLLMQPSTGRSLDIATPCDIESEDIPDNTTMIDKNRDKPNMIAWPDDGNHEALRDFAKSPEGRRRIFRLAEEADVNMEKEFGTDPDVLDPGKLALAIEAASDADSDDNEVETPKMRSKSKTKDKVIVAFDKKGRMITPGRNDEDVQVPDRKHDKRDEKKRLRRQLRAVVKALDVSYFYMLPPGTSSDITMVPTWQLFDSRRKSLASR